MQSQALDPHVWDFHYRYRSAALGSVVTLSEAVLLWAKSEGAFRTAWIEGKIDGRKTLSGGTILLEYESIVAHYGMPEFNPLVQLQEEE